MSNLFLLFYQIQDEKNQILTTNAWLNLVSDEHFSCCRQRSGFVVLGVVSHFLVFLHKKYFSYLFLFGIVFCCYNNKHRFAVLISFQTCLNFCFLVKTLNIIYIYFCVVVVLHLYLITFILRALTDLFSRLNYLCINFSTV